jgi:flavodoxin
VKAAVVYESLWGNTAAVARAIAEGIGPDARALSTAEATPDVIAGADLIVGGAPLLGFKLPDDGMRESIRANKTYKTPDLSHPSMRDWLAQLPAGNGRGAGFETRIWWSPGSAAKTIATDLAALGYAQAAPPGKFVVTGRYGPLKDGELDRARAWGAQLARSAGAQL